MGSPEARPARTPRTQRTALRVVALALSLLWSRGLSPAWTKTNELLAWPLRGLVWLYRKTLSSGLSPACRFVPSCSEYAAEALKVHGFTRGGALMAWRICRCHPFAKAGWDPVPGTHATGQAAPACEAHPGAIGRDDATRSRDSE